MQTPTPAYRYQGMLRNLVAMVVQRCRDLGTKNRKLEQVVEALGDANRWFASEHYGHPVTAEEAMKYYLDHGGPEGFARRIEEHRRQNPWFSKSEKEKERELVT